MRGGIEFGLELLPDRVGVAVLPPALAAEFNSANWRLADASSARTVFWTVGSAVSLSSRSK
ncbi:hypothetical protein XI03_04520 [Bradyrhizobium sp. CCBAU 65884]|uniref:hypothetical protein n=1 Tax=Bradyrhizobium sp. CCBAU 65884 TaxID=722477 RepID=UPI002305CB58|nr:hypothetical protein [Bradyrhizobium sp. CCBAU 65884]MDA9473790.1 hypothetical protein [Bradyrhizobium sp. CCBAU 65884]